MKLIIDTTEKTLMHDVDGAIRTLSLYTPEAFELLSLQWLKVGWNQKYAYTFTWLGRPIIQLPEDILRIQEAVYRLKPDVILETGIAHGGSLIFYASLCKIIGSGRVIGVDVEIRPQNRQSIETHPLASWITLVEGSSTAPSTIEQVKSFIKPGERVLVILDSDHRKAHVLTELRAYAPLVSVESYIIATDGVMSSLVDVPRGQVDWAWDNPQQAALEFVKQNQDFVLEEPPLMFDESLGATRLTYWPNSFLKRLR